MDWRELARVPSRIPGKDTLLRRFERFLALLVDVLHGFICWAAGIPGPKQPKPLDNTADEGQSEVRPHHINCRCAMPDPSTKDQRSETMPSTILTPLLSPLRYFPTGAEVHGLQRLPDSLLSPETRCAPLCRKGRVIPGYPGEAEVTFVDLTKDAREITCDNCHKVRRAKEAD